MDSSLHCTGSDIGLEQIWVKIRMHKSKCIYIGVAYIVPKGCSSETEIVKYQRHMDFAHSALEGASDIDLCYLLGDFNLPQIDWVRDDESGAFLLPLNVRMDHEACVIDELYTMDMLQVNDIQNYQGRLLDLVFTNDYVNTSICEACAQLLPNERFHKALELSIDFAFDNNKSSMPQMPFIFDFRNLDYDSFTEYFDQIDWQNEIGNRPVDDMVRIFYKKVEIGLNNWAPTVQRKTKSSQPPWVNRSLLHLINNKNTPNS